MLFLLKAGTGKLLLDILGMWGRFLCVTEPQSVNVSFSWCMYRKKAVGYIGNMV